jgi:hypothetical protein
VGPFRDGRAESRQRALTRDGEARLIDAPGSIVVESPCLERLAVARRFVVVERFHPRRPERPPKRLSLPLAGRFLVAARSHPTRDLGVWIEERTGVARRIFGLRQVDLSSDDPMAAWQQLDELTSALERALRSRGIDAPRAVEVGRGGHRVLMIDRGDRMTVYARPIFRERPRLIAELTAAGGVTIGRGRRRASGKTFPSRFAIVASGDWILVASAGGGPDLAIFLPWISEVDRGEIARRFGELVERPATAERAAPL